MVNSCHTTVNSCHTTWSTALTHHHPSNHTVNSCHTAWSTSVSPTAPVTPLDQQLSTPVTFQSTAVTTHGQHLSHLSQQLSHHMDNTCHTTVNTCHTTTINCHITQSTPVSVIPQHLLTTWSTPVTSKPTAVTPHSTAITSPGQPTPVSVTPQHLSHTWSTTCLTEANSCHTTCSTPLAPQHTQKKQETGCGQESQILTGKARQARFALEAARSHTGVSARVTLHARQSVQPWETCPTTKSMVTGGATCLMRLLPG